MKIKKININNFGLLSKKTINLENGINIIYSENKQVKSIIQNFIVCFLYGMDNERKVFKNVFRRKYSPFSMEKTKGEIIVEKDNIEYSIDRTFGSMKAQDTSVIKRVLDGEKIFNVDLDQPGKSFLNLGFEAFNRTMFVKNIDDFVSYDNNSKLMNDIVKIKENFDNRFSFDRSIELINEAKNIIKDIKISENLNELYEKYTVLNEKLEKANESVYLNSIDETKLHTLNKRKEAILSKYYILGNEINHFKCIETKNLVNDVLKIENDINKIKHDMDSINNSIPKIQDKPVDKDFIDDMVDKLESYKISKREILKIDKVDINEESKALERFEYLNKELDKYSKIKSNFLFYSEKVKKIEMLNKELDTIRGNGKISYLLKQYKNISRAKKNKQKRNYSKFYILIILVSILITFLAPAFNISTNGIILISLGALTIIAVSYIYMVFRDYRNIEDKDIYVKAGKFYDIRDQILKLEKEIYPYYYYKLKKDIDNILKIENELDSLSFRFKNGDLSYTSIIKEFKNEERALLSVLRNFGFEDLYIKDIENFIENIKFKLDYKIGIEKDLQDKNNKLLELLNGRDKDELITELTNLEKYESVEVNRPRTRVEEEYNVLKLELNEMQNEINTLKDNLKNKENNKNQVDIINDEILNLKNTILYLENKITNIDVYINKITDIYYEFKDTLSSEISSRIDYLIKYLINDYLSTTKKVYKYDKDNSSVLVKERLGLEFLNLGMWDLIYFALRITIADLIYEYKGEVPLILDDLFLSYDTNRMKKALMLLEKYSKDRQVILFASTKREINYLKGNAYIVNI